MRLNDCLTRHSCQWKFNERNSLSVPTWNSGGTKAVKLGAPWLVKEDSTVGRYFCKPLRVYKGTQSAGVVNWSRGHSTRRPSLLRIGSQWSVFTSGRSNSDAAAQGTKQPKVSMSLLEGVVPAYNPRRLHLMRWTQSLSKVKVSYLLERMSSSVTPPGRTASQGGGLSSFSFVARFFGGDALLVPGWFNFWCRGSLRHINGEVSLVVIRYDNSSYILRVKPREGLVKVDPSLLTQLVPFSLHFGCSHRGCWPADARGAWCIWPSGSSAATPQALFHLGRGRPSGYLWPPKEMNIADKP